MEKHNSVFKAITGVMAFTLIAKLMGFLREIVLAYYFGATGISDAFLISQTIPGTIFQFVGVGLTTCFIPIFFKVKNEKGEKATVEYTNRILTLIFLFSTLIIVLIWLDTPLVVKLFASGFEGETLYYAVWFTRIGVLSLYFSSMIYVFNSFLQANNIFIATAFAAIPNSICIIIAIVLGAKYNIWLLSIVSTIAVGIQLCFLLPFLGKTDYSFKIIYNKNDAFIHQFFLLLGPVIVGISINEVNTLVDRTIASQIAVGGISALTYANSVIQFVQGGLVQPITTVYYPRITSAVSESKHVEAKKLVERVLSLIIGILFPISVGFIIFSKSITELLFGHGAFDQDAVKLTSIAIIFYAVGICFVGVRELLSRYFYANSDTKTPMINATIGVVVNIIMNLAFSRMIGIAGLAIATSLSAFVSMVLLLIDCKRKMPHGALKFDNRQLLSIFIASVIMGTCAYSIYSLMSETVPALFISIMLGIMIYSLIGYCFKIEIIRELSNKLLRRK